MGEPPNLAEALRGFAEVEIGEAVGIPQTHGWKLVQQVFAHQMRQLSLRLADSQVDVGFAEIHGHELSVGIGDVQQPRVAPRGQGVVVLVGRMLKFCAAGQPRGDGALAQDVEKLAAIHDENGKRSRQAVLSASAWARDASAMAVARSALLAAVS